jgi:hypothetical protein
LPDDIRKAIAFDLRMGLMNKTVKAHLRDALSPKCDRVRAEQLMMRVADALAHRLQHWRIERHPPAPAHSTTAIQPSKSSCTQT